jgi:sec-independent protein translocase protein TatA
MLGSPVDIALIATVALVVFGPKKLPELGKSLGLGIANFKKGMDLNPSDLSAQPADEVAKIPTP